MLRSIPRPILAVSLILALTGGVAGCRESQRRLSVGGAAPAEPSPTAAEPSPTAAAPLASSTVAPPTPPAPPPAAGLTPTTTQPVAAPTTRNAVVLPVTTVVIAKVPSTTTTAQARPQVVVPQQGDRVVAVFVATGPSPAGASFTQAKARLSALGYHGYSGGDTACSQGAVEALPHLQDYSLSVEFATRANAESFAELYGPTLGIATVTVYCVD